MFHQLLPAPKLPLGTLGRIEWHKDSRHLGFALASSKSPSDVYSLDVRTNAVTRWTRHEPMAVDMNEFVEPGQAPVRAQQQVQRLAARRQRSEFIVRLPLGEGVFLKH